MALDTATQYVARDTVEFKLIERIHKQHVFLKAISGWLVLMQESQFYLSSTHLSQNSSINNKLSNFTKR